jgi:DNA-binding NtrC family response regulator
VLVEKSPTQARAQIFAALDATGGDMGKTAPKLGISRKQLYNIIDKLKLWPAIERRGYKRHAGPARIGPVRRFVRRLFR